MFALQPSDAAVPGTQFTVDRKIQIRELLVALSLGGVLGLVDFAVVFFWFGLSAYKSAAIALTVLLVVVLGTSAGTLLPILFRRLGMDPAIMSNPLIAAIVDVLGVVIFYEVAMILL
jgi:magnesium transporter